MYKHYARITVTFDKYPGPNAAAVTTIAAEGNG